MSDLLIDHLTQMELSGVQRVCAVFIEKVIFVWPRPFVFIWHVVTKFFVPLVISEVGPCRVAPPGDILLLSCFLSWKSLELPIFIGKDIGMRRRKDIDTR